MFWIRPSPDDTYQYVLGQGLQKGTSWYEEVCHSDLMLTSLNDGTTRRLFSGMNRGTSLSAGQFGVSWEVPTPFPGKPTTYYACVSDGSVHTLEALKRSGFYFYGNSSVEFGNRLYWFSSSLASRTDRHTQLLSATLDGAELREIAAKEGKRRMEGTMLYVFRSQLYGCFTESPPIGRDAPGLEPTAVEAVAVRHDYLCRIHPERSDPIEIIFKLPERAKAWQFNQGYLYFNCTELKGSAWATLTRDEASMDSTTALCRVPLGR